VKTGSLRKKIMTWSFVPTAIILVAVGSVSLYAYQQVTENLVIERDRELTRLSATLLGRELEAYTDPFSEQYLAVFDGIVVFDGKGMVVAAEPMQYELSLPSWFNSVAVRQALASTSPVFSNIIVDSSSGGRLVAVVIPFTGPQSSPGGGIVGLYRLDTATDSILQRSMEAIRREACTCLYLVDGNGQVIYHTNPELIGTSFSEQPVVQQVVGGEVGALRTLDVQGAEIVASFAPVPGTPWGLVTEESWAELTRTSYRFGRLLFGLLVLAVAAPTVIVALGARRITQPIEALICAAREIASGHFGQRIGASTGDELEELGRQFDLMAAHLQESYAHLEQKVADRTKELAALNVVAAEVSQSLDLVEILNGALDQVLAVMKVERGQAFRLEEETGTLVLMAHRGWSPDLIAYSARLSLDESVVGQAVRRGEIVFAQVDELPDGELKEIAQAEGIWTLIATPLVAKGKTVGALALGRRSLRAVTPEERSLLTAIGHQVGMAVENAHLYEQAQQLAVMKERGRLARDLHDSVTQALYGATLYSEAAARQLSSGDRDLAVAHLREIRSTTEEALREMRLLIFELRPPILSQEGLSSALQARLDAVEGRVGLETRFLGDGVGRLSPQVEEALYRIAQEALNNALKHAQARSITVKLGREGQRVSLEIADDGLGFDPAAVRECGGFGLRGMEERAARLGGTLTVQSRPGAGTTIKVEVST
jgi:signal transduction histidine kinase